MPSGRGRDEQGARVGLRIGGQNKESFGGRGGGWDGDSAAADAYMGTHIRRVAASSPRFVREQIPTKLETSN